MKEKMLLFLKKPVVIFSLLIFILTLFVNLSVVYFGDDFFYLTFTDGGFDNFVNSHVAHYLETNGRVVVHLLDTVFLSLPTFVWAIFNSLMLASITYFGSKIILSNDNNTKSKFIVPLILFCGTCLLHVSIIRQSVYWITGSLNYVYPLCMLFIYWYLLQKYIGTKKCFTLTLIFGILAAASTEQIGMMTVGLTFLNILYMLINKKKIDFKTIILFVVALVAAATVIFSPATFLRYNLELELSQTEDVSIINTAKYIVNSFFFSKGMLIPNLILLVSCLTYIYYNSTNKIKKILCILIVFSIILIVYNAYFLESSGVFDLFKIASALILGITYTAICTYISIKLFKESILVPVSSILLFGSQLMMIISPVYGPRNLLCAIFMMLLISSYLLSKITLNKIACRVICSLLIIVAILNITKTAIGYLETNAVEQENIKLINEYRDTSKTLVLKCSPNSFNWSMPYESEYHKYYYMQYHQIKCEKDMLTWE